jgi:hypothetical protein
LEILSLYDETLFVDNAQVDTSVFLGTYKKGICVVLRETEFSDDNLATLTKILASCGLVVDDCYICKVGTADLGNFISQMMPAIRPRKLISFDVPVQSSTMNMLTELYSVKKIGSMEIILSHGFTALNMEGLYKKHLWSALKVMFDIQ